MEQLTAEFIKLRQKAIGREGLSESSVHHAFLKHVRTRQLRKEWLRRREGKTRKRCLFLARYFCFPVLMAVIFTPIFVPQLLDVARYYIQRSPCLLDTNLLTDEISRPLFNCSVCEGLTDVPVETDLTTQRFLERYAYSMLPVLVKGAAANWTAIGTFDFRYFRRLYHSVRDEAADRSRAGDDNNHDNGEENEEAAVEYDCQFFPYKTEFAGLMEALDMPETRADYKEGEKPWYFGWYVHRLSDCTVEPTLHKVINFFV